MIDEYGQIIPLTGPYSPEAIHKKLDERVERYLQEQMAEAPSKPVERPQEAAIFVVPGGGVRIEHYADTGITIVFFNALYDYQLTKGESVSGTRKLDTRLTISPHRSPQNTGVLQGPSAPTKLHND